MKKLIFFELIIALCAGITVLKFYYDYRDSLSANEISRQKIEELNENILKSNEECEQLSDRINELRDSMEIERLELWKTKVQKLEAYLKQ